MDLEDYSLGRSFLIWLRIYHKILAPLDFQTGILRISSVSSSISNATGFVGEKVPPPGMAARGRFYGSRLGEI